MLVAGGASLTIPDHQGNTPRHLALNAEDHELAAYFESKFHITKIQEIQGLVKSNGNSLIFLTLLYSLGTTFM